MIGDDLDIDWDEIKLEEFTKGLSVELEHGTKYPETNVTNNPSLNQQFETVPSLAVTL